MARRAAKAARRKEAKRQRALEKRAEKAKARAFSVDCTASAAANRLALLRDAVTRGEPHPPRGMVNLGNTCFFNAVAQCLARVAAFREYFVGKPPLPGEGSMTTALRGFFVEMWTVGESSAMNPSALFAEVGKRNSVFKGRAQQDSHELMKVIFDAVVEEEKDRLTNVARGLLPDAIEEEQDCTSENGASSTGSSTTVTDDADDRTASVPESDPIPGIILLPQAGASPDDANKLLQDEEIPVIEKPFESLILEESSGMKDVLEFNESTSLEAEEEKPISPERLGTIVARTVGGLLSSTIVCMECGTKSSVDEPFLDLQLPLVPKNENDTKPAEDSQPAESNAQAPISSNPSATSNENGDSDDVVPSKRRAPKLPSTAIAVASVPPPPPPPPLPPIRTRAVKPIASQILTGGDVMQELRQNVERVEPESEVRGRQLPFQGSSASFVDTFSPEDDDANAIFGDDDDVEGFACLSSLFDSDIGDENADVVDDISGMSAYSTAEAAKATNVSANLTPSEPSSKKQPAQAATNTRRTSAFFCNLLGGFGGHAPAPYGYKSVVGSLEEFTKVEVLEGDNAYGCDECTRREKLRIALQSRNSQANVRKKVDVSAERCAEIIDDVVPIDQGCGEKRVLGKELPALGPTSGELRVDTNEEQKIIPTDGGNGGELVSSPVTSSESSSGISSEDDGELVIEEEPEDKPARLHHLKSLTRGEEDELVRAMNVKVPTVRSSAEKRFIIRRAPEVLLIQLKRFSQFGYRGGLRKISGRVAFPIELDITPFVEQDPKRQEATEKEKVLQNVSKRKRGGDAKSSIVQAHRYILIGVTVHGGSLSGGHYTAYVREGVEPDGRGGWYFCNDSKTSRASEKDVLNSEAYLLYYERVKS